MRGIHYLELMFEVETAGVVEHFANGKATEWESVMKADKGIFSKVGSVIGEIPQR